MPLVCWKLRVAAILEWHAAASKLIHDPDREGAQLPVAGLHDARPVLARPFFYVKNGGEEGNRTPDTGIFSPLLYHLSYLATSRLHPDGSPSFLQSNGRENITMDAPRST